VASTVVLAVFIFNVLRFQQLPELLLPTPKHNYKALPEQQSLLRGANQRPARRKTARKPSEIPFNTGEGLRAAYYVPDDPASYSSLKEHAHQIDLLFPQWLHVDAPQGTLLAINGDSHREYPVIDGFNVHDPDETNKVKRVIQASKEEIEIFPHLNNFNPSTQKWDPAIAGVLADGNKSAALRQQIVRFFIAFPAYRGLSLDIESLPDNASPAYVGFIHDLYADLHARNLRLYVNAMVSTTDDDFRQIAANSDGIILMNYDEHEVESQPGPVASQEWFVNNLRRVLTIVPKEKLICAVGNFGYDWTLSIPNPKDRKHRKPRVIDTEDLSVPEAIDRKSVM
jgi:spore germination protein YaaH